MIDIDYIHARDIDEEIDRCFRQRQMAIDTYYGECAMAETQMNDLKMFGALTAEKEDYFEESVGDAMRRVGEVIIKIIEKMKDTVKGAVQFIKSKVWFHKDTDKKLEMIAKENPKAVDKLRIAVKKGDLDLNSFKDLNDFFRNMENVMDEIDKRTVDPKTIRGKIQKAKEKLVKNQDAVKTVASAIGIVTAVGGFYLTYKNFKSNNLQREIQQITNRCSATIDKLEKENDAMRGFLTSQRATEKIAKGASLTNREKNNLFVSPENTGNHAFALKAEIAAELERVYTGNIRKRTQLLLRFTRGFDSLATKLTGSSSTNQQRQVMHALYQENRRKIAANRRERNSAFALAQASHVDPTGTRHGTNNTHRGGRPNTGGNGGNQGGGNP